jgi:hypothetical protein
MPEKPHPAELVAYLARLAEVRQLLAAIESGDLDRIERVKQVLRARIHLYEDLTEPAGARDAGDADARQGRLL